MNIQDIGESNKWGPRSVTFWHGFVQPEVAIQGFGLKIHHSADASMVRIKVDRDLFIGLFIAALLFSRM
jgi:hypothetical protein